MTEVKVPPEIVDPDFEHILTEYTRLRNDFWKTYKDNKRQAKSANDAQELKDDISRMSKDLSNLTLRLEKQKEKVDSVPNKITYMDRAKAFRAEINQQKKLTNQYKTTKELVRNLDDLKNNLKSSLEIKKHSRRGNVNIVKQMEEEIKVNKIICTSELPSNLKGASKELILCEAVATEYLPSDEELQKLKSQVNLTSLHASLFVMC